jgi:hypothetical protein
VSVRGSWLRGRALLAAPSVTVALFAVLQAAPAIAEPAPARWSGIDESVIEKVAAAAGRAPRPLLFDLEGDLALFVFLCAGIAGGSVLGYYFRVLFVERLDERPPQRAESQPGVS